MGFDIIGDIHGQCGKLEALLRKLGYREAAGCWCHPERQAIFVGDFIDRGPRQERCVKTVRRMVDAGAALAVMGNHEFNAIAWHTPDVRRPGEYLRQRGGKRGGKNRKQHEAFLAEVEDRPCLHADIIEWFLALPLWLDLPELQVVHACWHPAYMKWLSPRLRDGCYLTRSLMVQATDEPPDESEKDNATPSVFKAVECLVKGIEIPLPGDRSFTDKDGFVRARVRVRWWDAGATTYRAAAMLSDEECAALPELPIPCHARVEETNKPVFFGHYWLTGQPSLQAPRAVCLDYSAGNGGPLVAYRFDGELELSPEHLAWVD